MPAAFHHGRGPQRAPRRGFDLLLGCLLLWAPLFAVTTQSRGVKKISRATASPTVHAPPVVHITGQNRPIRLELLSHHSVHELLISSKSGLQLMAGAGRQSMPGPLRITWQSATLQLESGGKTQKATGRLLTITSATPLTVAVSRQSAQIGNRLEVRRVANGLHLVAELPLEAYLRNVVTGEGGDMPDQALRAMAVLARTWALENRGRHQHEGFDFCSSTHCEVWSLHPPSPRAVNAVDQTSGEVLEYHDRLADVFYSADCGGETAPGSTFIDGRRAPYLASRADPWCAWSPQTNWTTILLKAKLAALMAKAGWLSHPWQSLQMEVLRRDQSGRVSELAVTGASTHVVKGRDFRFLVNRALGWNRIKSTLFDVIDEGDSLRFVGHGLGHGAGLCEAGAEGMARSGRDYRQILAFYFPGTTLLSLPAPKAKQQAMITRPHPRFVPAAWHGNDSGYGWHYAASGPCQVRYRNSLPRPVLDLCPRLIEEAERRTGLPLNGPLRLTVYPTVSAFIATTGRPGWIAAATRGHEIGLLPLAVIERRRRLSNVLRHEILHVLIGDHTAPGTSLCLQEGAVLYFTGEARQLPPARGMGSGSSLNDVLQRPRSTAEFDQALSACAARAASVVHQQGEAALLQRLRQGN